MEGGKKTYHAYIQQAIDDIIWGEVHDPSMIDCYESALVAELSAAYASGRITKYEIEDIRRKYLHEE